jgi:hypothetical protein
VHNPAATPLILRRTQRRATLPEFVPVSDDLPPFLYSKQADEEEDLQDDVEFVNSRSWPTVVSRHARAGLNREG